MALTTKDEMMSAPVSESQTHKSNRKGSIKCLVWDLDQTLWDGVLLEGDYVSLRNNVVTIIETLDRRGILQSVASKNDDSQAMAKLREFGLAEYFLYPQIGWGSKASSIETIAKSINIGLDTVAFIDDQPFEREEVQFSLPVVRCFDAADLARLLDLPELNPRFVTTDSQIRRQMYLSEMERNRVEADFTGPKEAFLASLDMRFTIFPAKEEDLKRAEELTVRTNQLNATSYTYAYDELNRFRQSAHHKLLMARLEDKYGTYGHIGLALIECQETVWTLKLLLMSCRVMSRGVGSLMLNHIMRLAKAENVRLLAEFVPNGRNRMMEIAYRFASFAELEKRDKLIILENDLATIQPNPDYVEVQIDEPD